MADASEGETPPLEERDALSINALNGQIAVTFDHATYLEGVVCRAEIDDLSDSGTTLFFTLSDGEGEPEIQCVLFRWEYEQLGLTLEEGMEVVVKGDVEFYEERGNVQLRPDNIAHVGAGAMRAEIDRRTADLEERGWFEDDAKQTIPYHPECVGVVTSRDGDARHDIESELHSRHPGIGLELRHASVQGEHAPDQIAEGIAELDAADDVDVVIVGRGGGSDRDLMAFNTEAVAEAHHRAETPTVSAVGHREDETIACRVADTTVKTPTAAGALFVDRSEYIAHLRDLAVSVMESHTQVAEAHVTRHRHSLRSSYRGLVGRRLSEDRRRVRAAHDRFVEGRLATLRNRVDTAYQQHKHATAVEDAENAVPTVYKAAVVVLVLLVIALAFILLL